MKVQEGASELRGKAKDKNYQSDGSLRAPVKLTLEDFKKSFLVGLSNLKCFFTSLVQEIERVAPTLIIG